MDDGVNEDEQEEETNELVTYIHNLLNSDESTIKYHVD